jgi:transcriptional regulator with XRE-family HTH domain
MDKISVIEELFQKKLGIVIKNARELRKRSIQECATVIGVEVDIFKEYEFGTSAPSLPELELLAFYLDLPIQHFFNSILEKDTPVFEDAKELKQFYSVRQKVIATRLKSYRMKKGLPPTKMIANTNLTEEQYARFEEGQDPIPLTNLQAFMYPLGCSLKEFLAEGGKIGKKYRAEKAQQTLEDIPQEVQVFLTNPSNEPYLRLAMHLSTLSAERLRNIAEGLLEITY